MINNESKKTQILEVVIRWSLRVRDIKILYMFENGSQVLTLKSVEQNRHHQTWKKHFYRIYFLTIYSQLNIEELQIHTFKGSNSNGFVYYLVNGLL